MNLETLATCWSAKDRPCTSSSSSCLWVVCGILRVLLMALFQSVFICLNCLFAVKVPSSTPIPRTTISLEKSTPHITGNDWELVVKLVYLRYKNSYLALMPSESLKFWVILLPKCFTLALQAMCDPCSVTLRRGKCPLLPIHIHMVFFALNLTLYSSAKSSHVCNSSWRACMEGVSRATSSAYPSETGLRKMANMAPYTRSINSI